jgi:hypothetical protein
MRSELPTTTQGFVLARDMREAGREAELYAAVQSGRLQRVRRGVYSAPRPDDGAMTPPEKDALRYRALVRAAAQSLDRPVFTSYSAAALLELPVLGRWPDSVYVMSRDSNGNRRPGVISVARTTDTHIRHVGGFAVTSVEFTLIQLCRHASLGAALTAVDAALHAARTFRAPPPLTTIDRLVEEHERLKPYPGSRRTDEVLRRATHLAETPLETASRLVIEELGFPPPELQRELWLPELGRRAYLDFGWPEYDIGAEADGRGKYRGSGDVEVAIDTVMKEKEREDEIRRLIRAFTRWDWNEMWARRPIDRRLRRAGLPVVRRPRRLLVASDRFALRANAGE